MSFELLGGTCIVKTYLIRNENLFSRIGKSYLQFCDYRG